MERKPANAMSYRALPNAVNAEKSILSSMLQEPDGSMVDVAIEAGINEDVFYVPAHRKVFNLLKEISGKGQPIELISFTKKLQENDWLEDVGGHAGITEIYSYAPTAAHFNHHCKIVISKYRLREVIAKCTTAIGNAYDEPEEVDSFIDSVESSIFSISRYSNNDSTTSSSDTLLKNSISNLESYINGNKSIEGLPTRFKLFNDLTKGLKKSEMIIIAARPSMGKTAILGNIVEDLTVNDVPGLVFSLEMTRQQFMDRILYGRAGFRMHFMKKGFQPTRGELMKIEDSFRDLSKKNLFIDDKPGISLDEVRAKARRKKKENGIEYIGIDYLQLMTCNQKFQSREQEVSYISKGLKSLSKELDIPVVVLAQLNRSPEKRSDGLPKLSDLRESGSIEQDADVVGLLYRPGYYNDEEEEEVSKGEKAVLIIAKNRNGPTGPVEMKFQKETMQFK